MSCPQCGYNLQPFETTCPRCERAAKQGAAGSQMPTQPMPTQQMQAPPTLHGGPPPPVTGHPYQPLGISRPDVKPPTFWGVAGKGIAYGAMYGAIIMAVWSILQILLFGSLTGASGLVMFVMFIIMALVGAVWGCIVGFAAAASQNATVGIVVGTILFGLPSIFILSRGDLGFSAVFDFIIGFFLSRYVVSRVGEKV